MALLPEQQLLTKSDECRKEFPFAKPPHQHFWKRTQWKNVSLWWWSKIIFRENMVPLVSHGEIPILMERSSPFCCSLQISPAICSIHWTLPVHWKQCFWSNTPHVHFWLGHHHESLKHEKAYLTFLLLPKSELKLNVGQVPFSSWQK